MATEAETELTTTKLQLENDSLKRRLAKYATTLEELTLHAKREISSSARARDEALAAAGESVTLREAMSDMEAALADAHAQRDAAQHSLQERADRLREAQENTEILEEKIQQLSGQLEETRQSNVVSARALTEGRERELETKVREFEDVTEVLRTDLRGRDDQLSKGKQQIAQLEDSQKLLQQRVSSAEAAVQEAESALRQELDQALKELGERNAVIDEMKVREKASIDAREVVQERDDLRCNVNQLQEELEQSTEMLTRAAIDALGDKGRIRKLEEALGKTKDQLGATIAEKTARERKVSAFGQAVARLEKELDSERISKRALADQCHKYQMHIHEQEKVVASKTRAYEELNSDRNDRAFQVDRVSLELSNAKNTLAKKESDYVNLAAEYDDVRTQLKSTAKDLEDRHIEVSTTRKELTTALDEAHDLKEEQERLKTTISELQVSRRQLQELSALAAEKDEELSKVTRWYSAMKTEVGEALREKKRLSDMLSDVSGDLKRANQELDILRNMRKDNEVLAARISNIGETSTRELSALRKNQTEQATALAKNTVAEYTRRLEEMQIAAQRDIAATVANQLRSSVMPQLMHAVDSKAKHLVTSLARHVESFTLETETSFQAKYSEPDLEVTDANAESITGPDTNVATAYGSGVASESRSAITSAFRSAPPSAPRSAIPSNFIPSATDSPPVSVPDVSRVDSVEGSTAGPSNISPEPSIEQPRSYPILSPVVSPTGSPIEAQSEDGDAPLEVEATREISVPALPQESDEGQQYEETVEPDHVQETQTNPEPITEPDFEPAPVTAGVADSKLEVQMEAEEGTPDLGAVEETEDTRELPPQAAEEDLYEERGYQYRVSQEGDAETLEDEVAPPVVEGIAPESDESVEIVEEPEAETTAKGNIEVLPDLPTEEVRESPTNVSGLPEDVAEPALEDAAPTVDMAESADVAPEPAVDSYEEPEEAAEPVVDVAEAAADVTEPAMEASDRGIDIAAVSQSVPESTEDVTVPAEETAAPITEFAEPIEEVSEPVVEAKEEAEDEELGPTDGVAIPTDAVTEEAEEVTEPAEGTAEPAEGAVEPAEGAVEPAEGIAEPAEGIAEPAEGTVEPAEGIAEPAEGIAEPADEVPLSTDIAVETAAEVTEPTAEVIDPPQEVEKPLEEALEQTEESPAPTEEAAALTEALTDHGEEPANPTEEVTAETDEIVGPAEETVEVPEETVDIPEDTAAATDRSLPPIVETAEAEGAGTTDGAVEELDLTAGAQEEDYEGTGFEGDEEDVYGEAIIEELDENGEGYISGMPPEMVPEDYEEMATAGYVQAEVIYEEQVGGSTAYDDAEVYEAAETLASTGMTDDTMDNDMPEPSEEPETGHVSDDNVGESAEPAEEPVDDHEGSGIMGDAASDDMGMDERADMGLGDNDVPDIAVDSAASGQDSGTLEY